MGDDLPPVPCLEGLDRSSSRAGSQGLRLRLSVGLRVSTKIDTDGHPIPVGRTLTKELLEATFVP